MRYNLYFIWIYLRRNFLAWTLLIMGLIFFWYETAALEFELSGQLRIAGLWTFASTGLQDYIVQIMMHQLLMFLGGLLLALNVMQSYKESGAFEQIIISGKGRIQGWMEFLGALFVVLVSIFCLYLIALWAYLYGVEKLLLFHWMLLSPVYLFFPFLFVLLGTSYFVLIFENHFSAVFATFTYLLVIPVITELMNKGNIQISDGLTKAAAYSEYYAPFYLEAHGDIYYHLTGLNTTLPSQMGFVLCCALFLILITHRLKRMVI